MLWLCDRDLSVDVFSKIPPKKVAIATFELPCHPLSFDSIGDWFSKIESLMRETVVTCFLWTNTIGFNGLQ